MMLWEAQVHPDVVGCADTDSLLGTQRKSICPLCLLSLAVSTAGRQGLHLFQILFKSTVVLKNGNHTRIQSSWGKCSREQGTEGHLTKHFWSSHMCGSSLHGRVTYPAPEDLVDGCTFFQCALSDHLRSHFLHIQHECIKGLLYVGLFLFFFLFGVLML